MEFLFGVIVATIFWLTLAGVTCALWYMNGGNDPEGRAKRKRARKLSKEEERFARKQMDWR